MFLVESPGSRVIALRGHRVSPPNTLKTQKLTGSVLPEAHFCTPNLVTGSIAHQP